MTDQETELIEYLRTLTQHNGIACATVGNGHIIMANRARLIKLLEENKDNENLVIFIHRPELKG